MDTKLMKNCYVYLLRIKINLKSHTDFTQVTYHITIKVKVKRVNMIK